MTKSSRFVSFRFGSVVNFLGEEGMRERGSFIARAVEPSMYFLRAASEKLGIRNWKRARKG